MGPSSQIWNGFVDPDQTVATYSIELGRSQQPATRRGLRADASSSNVTFGAANDESYIGQPSININGYSTYTYALSNFSFGIVYQADGADSSEYFEPLGTTFPVEFNTNFKGIGLPPSQFSQFSELFSNITSTTNACQAQLDGNCVLPNTCSSYSNLNDYSFKFNYESDTTNYMRVPLLAFSQDINGQCNIEVEYLQSTATNIVLGGMYFQEFFGVFANNYSDPYVPTQTATMYVGQNNLYAAAYIGNEQLAIGTNPFEPVDPPGPEPPGPTPEPSDDGGLSLAWVIVLSILGALVLILGSFFFYRWWKQRTGQIQPADQGNTSGEQQRLIDQKKINASEEV